MSSEIPTQDESEFGSFYEADRQSLSRPEVTALSGLKRRIADWRERRAVLQSADDGPNRALDGPWAAMFTGEVEQFHETNISDRNRLYHRSHQDPTPQPLGIFAGEGAASALDFARQVEQAHDSAND